MKKLLLSLVLIMAFWTPQPGPQVKAAVCPADFPFFGGTRGGGKMINNSGKILTPKGWTTHGEIKIDDNIINPVTGGSQKVIGVFPQGAQKLYKIVFDDKSNVCASIDHLWLYKCANRRRPGTKRSKQKEWIKQNFIVEYPSGHLDLLRVDTTKKLIKELESGRHNPRIPLIKPVVFDVNGRTGKSDLDPYLIGLMFGDGTFSSGSSGNKVTTGDIEIIIYLKTLGFTVSGEKKAVNGMYTSWYLPKRSPYDKILTSWLRNHKLLSKTGKDKHLPEYILTAPIDYRVAVLQGLLDSDGYVDKRGHVEFTNISDSLIYGVRDLVWSLGGKATVSEPIIGQYRKETGEIVECQTYRRVYIWTPFSSKLFRLHRKSERCVDKWSGGYENMRKVVSIEYSHKEEATCIKVSSPHGLYITDNYIITHNTDCLIGRQIRGAEKYNYAWNGLIVRRKYKEFSKIRNRFDELIRAGLPAERIGGDQQVNTIRFGGGGKVTMAAIQRIEMADDFIGEEFTEISIDECTTFPFFIKMVDKLSGSCRSPHGVPSRVFGTGNPGGPGHNDVKLFFKLGKEFNIKPNTVLYNHIGESRVYIPSFLKDNKILCESDPKYVRKLMSIRDPMLRRAWLEGDWDVYIGQAFLLSPEHHIIKPIQVPDHAPLYMTFDWGYAVPFSVGWWWVDADGRIYRFAEWYGWDEEENEGLRMVDSEMAKGIVSREKDLGIWGRSITRLCDPTCCNKKPDYKGGGQGPSTVQEFAKFGVFMRPGDPSRKLKIRQFRERLSIPEDERERPMLQVYDTCRHFISTIPSLCMDDHDPEDIDCFVAGTLIGTPGGDIPIECLSIGDLVDTPIGPREILKAGLAGNDRTIKINLSNGKAMEGTQDHKIYINNYGLLPLCLVSSGHTLTTKEDLCWFKNKFTEGSNLEDLKTEDILSAIHLMLQNLGQHYYTGLFGRTLKAQSLLDIISTTKIMIAETTPLKTWNWFIRVIMQDSISKKELKMVSLLTTLNGPKAEMEKKFLKETLRSAVRILPNENLRALIVANILKQNIPQKNTALFHARQHQKNERYVRSVGKNLSQKQPSTEKCRPVVISVDGPCEKKPVYYLTVKQAHLFYANGMMTANTDQADHTYDEACHICMARPMKLVEEPVIEKPKLDVASQVASIEYAEIIQQIQAEQDYMEGRR